MDGCISLLRTLVTFCLLMSGTTNGNVTESNSAITNRSEEIQRETTVQSAVFEVKDERNSTLNSNVVGKSHKRAASYDTAASTPWVRVYNRPPGTSADASYNYETRGNTSAHTNGEGWGSLKETFPEEERTPSVKRNDARIKDILRVRPKLKESPQSNISRRKSTTEAAPITKSTLPSNDTVPEEVKETASGEDTGNARTSEESNFGWPEEGKTSSEVSAIPTVDQIIPKDGSQWKVVGEGGQDGWQVVDDKGEVEWKIEYDDGEWRVTSTGEVPSDTEWLEPDYVWGSSDGSAADEDDYNSWPTDDYGIPPEMTNGSWNQNNDSYKNKNGQSRSTSDSGWKTSGEKDSLKQKEKLKFGARRKVPSDNEEPPSSEEDKANSESSETPVYDSIIRQNDENGPTIFIQKTWPPNPAVIKEQKWVQGYGSKAWEEDNTKWNTGTPGETLVIADKSYDPWVPKLLGQEEILNNTPKAAEGDISNTVYSTKTWNGDEWNKNIVWKIDYNSGNPWQTDNSTWNFPESSTKENKKQMWSQPLPTSVGKNTSPSPNIKNIQWPGNTRVSKKRVLKPPPSRRTGSEDWADDFTYGGVIWKEAPEDPVTTTAPVSQKPINQDSGWQSGEWKISPPIEGGKSSIASWKNYVPPKDSKIIDIEWNGDNSAPEYFRNIWNQGQWPDPNGFPTWIFGGCKMTLKCGENNPDAADDSVDQNKMPDTSDDSPKSTTTAAPTTVGKIWPVRTKGKSWKVPTKSWKPPTKVKPPTTTPEPTTSETMTPSMMWKPEPVTKWKKQNPPQTIIWKETPPSFPSKVWKKPAPPPSIGWKKGPKPTKSWRPPPTKSWKPSMPSMETWQPSIATPQPDMWPTAKPDCKNTTEPMKTTAAPSVEDEDDGETVDPPQIIIITKLPKGAYPRPDGNKNNTKKKIPFGPWIFPSRKGSPKGSKDRKDKNINIGSYVKDRPVLPLKANSLPPNWYNGWPKAMPPPNFVWPSKKGNKKGPAFPLWKYPKYMKSKSWRQMFKKWLERNG